MDSLDMIRYLLKEMDEIGHILAEPNDHEERYQRGLAALRDYYALRLGWQLHMAAEKGVLPEALDHHKAQESQDERD